VGGSRGGWGGVQLRAAWVVEGRVMRGGLVRGLIVYTKDLQWMAWV